MRKIERSGAFKKDYKRIRKSGHHNDALNRVLPDILKELCSDQPLDIKHRDHPLSADWDGYRECHIKPDLLLIYSKWTTDEDPPVDVLGLARLGSHSDLFE